MDSQDKRMCKAESSFSGGTVEYNHDVYDEDCFGDILNIFDFPMENLEGDGLAEDWASKLGPIPSEVFREMLPPVSQIGLGNGNGNGSSADLLPRYSVSNARTSQLKRQSIHQEETFKGYKVRRTSQHKQQPTSFEEKKPNLLPGAFEAPSPNSVLESRSSSSSGKSISFGIEISVPARTRSKRSRPTTNPWLLSPLIIPQNKDKQKKRRNRAATHHHHHHHHPATMESKNPLERSNPAAGVKKCTHCEITKTPQWREGPMGPKTLCNACGVRYRSGRLFPEYRPAASPTFVPSLHSNSHRKVIEMRQKVNSIQKGAAAGKDGNYGLL